MNSVVKTFPVLKDDGTVENPSLSKLENVTSGGVTVSTLVPVGEFDFAGAPLAVTGVAELSFLTPARKLELAKSTFVDGNSHNLQTGTAEEAFELTIAVEPQNALEDEDMNSAVIMSGWKFSALIAFFAFSLWF